MAFPFPVSPFATLLGSDVRMETALATAFAETLISSPALAGVAISMVAIDESSSPPDFLHGGIRFGETHFSASLLKVAAMYAAFELRKSVRERAASSGAGGPALHALLNTEFDPIIDPAVPAVSSDPGVTRAMRVPKYRDVFDLSSSPIAFNPSFEANLRAAIVDSNNAAAGACIQALGYSWINGTLEQGGFFFPPSQSGIWLAGTFIGVWPYVRIPSVNDGPVAQAMTCFDMANLCAHIFRRTLVDDDASVRMSKLLQDAAILGPDASFIDHVRRSGQIAPRSFFVTHNKVGLGPLKTGAMVASEATILNHAPSDRNFLTVWQNCPNEPAAWNAVATVVERSIELFLAAP